MSAPPRKNLRTPNPSARKTTCDRPLFRAARAGGKRAEAVSSPTADRHGGFDRGRRGGEGTSKERGKAGGPVGGFPEAVNRDRPDGGGGVHAEDRGSDEWQ